MYFYIHSRPHLVIVALVAELTLRSQKIAVSFAAKNDLDFLLSSGDTGWLLAAKPNSELVGLSMVQGIAT